MLLSELPLNIQEQLTKERSELETKWYKNDGYNLVLVNKEGTRYFVAHRENDFCGGGCSYNQWRIHYGMIQWCMHKENMFGEVYTSYKWVQGKTFGARNGIEIPRTLNKKAEVIQLAKSLGIFNI